jgi:hypothetical protein
MFYGFVPDQVVVWTARHALSAGYGSRVQIRILNALENQEECTVQRLDDLLVEKLNYPDMFVRIAVMRLMWNSRHVPKDTFPVLERVFLDESEDENVRTMAATVLLDSGYRPLSWFSENWPDGLPRPAETGGGDP